MLRERRKKLLWDEVQLRRHFLIVGLLNGEQIAREVIVAGSLEQSLLVSSSSTISGESFDVMNSSMTAPSFDRYNSSMIAINSLITQFKETQDDATFILSSIDDNHGMGPLQVADHCASLRDVMTLMRKMASALGALKRNQSHLVTLDSLAFMQDSLDDLANRRTVCYRNPDEKPEDAETVSDVSAVIHLASDVDPSRVVSIEALEKVSEAAKEDSEGLANDPEGSPFEFVELSSITPDDEIPEAEKATDVTKDASAAIAPIDESLAVKPLHRFFSLINFLNQNTGTVSTRTNHSTTPPGSGTVSSTTPKVPIASMFCFAKEEPPWYRLVKGMPSTLLFPPRSFSTTDMADLLTRMRMSLLWLLFSGSVHSPENKL